jgi:hypothetical protein
LRAQELFHWQPGGPIAGEPIKGNTMINTLFLSMARFTIPAFSGLACFLNKYRAARVRKTRVAKHAKLLVNLDAHMLNDIGMTGFSSLTNEEQARRLFKFISQKRIG